MFFFLNFLLKESTSIQLSVTFLSAWQFVCICFIEPHTYPSFLTFFLFMIKPPTSYDTIPKYLRLLINLKSIFSTFILGNQDWACWVTTTTKCGECKNLLPLLPRTHNSQQTADEIISSFDKTVSPLTSNQRDCHNHLLWMSKKSGCSK